ncbi:MAG: hypothetical protein ACW97P_06800 [Candidatus Hodarchaeales archaeon]|jgi:hypothetical protein
MDIQTVSIALAGIGIFIAAINSIISSRKADQQRQTEVGTRQAELLMELYREWRSLPFRKATFRILDSHWEDYDDFIRKYGPEGSETDREEYINTYVRLATFYARAIGVLVQQRFIDINLVDKLLHNQIKFWWERVGPLILEEKKRRIYGHYTFDPAVELAYRIIEMPESTG